MKFRILLITLLLTAFSFAQNEGTIKGTLTDKNTPEKVLSSAKITITDLNISTETNKEGQFSINVPSGDYIVEFSLPDYVNNEIMVTVRDGEVVAVNESLAPIDFNLKEVVIRKRTSDKQTETALLNEQKIAVGMKQAIGAEELSRKGVGDAATAVAKTAGVANQEGSKNVSVRGLGDRYNSSSLNGLPLPSEDPEYKNISLRFFATNIIKNISINKTFDAAMYGDVTGANIDINSKELTTKQELDISIGAGINSNIPSDFQVSDTYNYFGVVKNGSEIPVTNLNNYSFENNFNTNYINKPINTNFSISGGKKFTFKNNNNLSLYGVAFSTNEYNYKKDAKTGAVNANGGIIQDLTYNKSEFNTTQAGLVNAKYEFNKNHISYNSLYIHDNKQSVGDYLGFTRSVNDNDDAQNSFIKRQQANNNILFSNQLLSEFKLTEKIESSVAISYNSIKATEPDRRTNAYDFNEADQTYRAASNSSGLNHRFFSTLEENDLAGKIEATYSFNPDEELGKKITVGGDYRNTDRRFEATQFNHDFPNNLTIVDVNNPDAVFNQTSIDNNVFTLETARGNGQDAFDPFYYTGKREIISAYTQFNYPVNEKLNVVLGLRNENIHQIVEWDTNISSSVKDLTLDPSIIDKNYILPNLTSKFSLSDKNAIRFAASQTYTYPQFKETAPFLYEDITFSSFGNPDLTPSENINFDLKYDFYLSKKEIISLGGFYKKIKDPINRMSVASAANELSYVNLGDASVTGLEFEIRKTIFDTENENVKNDLNFGLNASYLYSKVNVYDNPNDKLTILPTNDNSQLEGASPLLINTDLSYNFKSSKNLITSSIVLNYFHDKVYSIGTSDRENIVEKAVTTLDFISKYEILKNKIGFNLAFKNILDPTYKLTQEILANSTNSNSGEFEVSSYKKGITTSLGIYWKM